MEEEEGGMVVGGTKQVMGGMVMGVEGVGGVKGGRLCVLCFLEAFLQCVFLERGREGEGKEGASEFWPAGLPKRVRIASTIIRLSTYVWPAGQEARRRGP